MQIDRILDKASRLGMSIDTNLSNEENIAYIASLLGVDSDNLNAIENRLDDELAANNYGDFDEYIPTRTISSDAEQYNNEVSENNYSPNRQRKLDQQVEDASNEKNNNIKEVPNDNLQSESQKIGKNKFDIVKTKDDNLTNARKNPFLNKINDAKSKIDQLALNNKANEIKDNLKDSVKHKAKEVGKEATKKATSTLISFIKKNPYVLAIVGIIFLILLIVIIIGGNVNNNSSNSKGLRGYEYYPGICDKVQINDKIIGLDEYVAGNVAHEMSPRATSTYYPETLKMEAVAARTFAVQHGVKVGEGDSCYYNMDAPIQKVGFNPEAVTQIHTDAVEATRGLIILLDGKPRTHFDACCLFTPKLAKNYAESKGKTAYVNTGDFKDDKLYFLYGERTIDLNKDTLHFQEVEEDKLRGIHSSTINDCVDRVETYRSGLGYGISEQGSRYLEQYEGYTWNQIIDFYYDKQEKIVSIYEVLEDDNENNDYFWWPIGSRETTTRSNIIFATGTPASVNITAPFNSFDDVHSGVHDGIDIGSVQKNVDNVIAAKDGTVIYPKESDNISHEDGSISSSGYGNYVIIDHGDGTTTLYGHMYKDTITVRAGDSVKQGQVIGKVGSSGRSTGTHLHFTIKVNGIAIDPEKYVSASNPRPVSAKKDYSGSYSTNSKDSLYTNANYLRDLSYSELLKNNGYTIDSFNEFLSSEINKAGVGTREGVVAAAMTLIGANAEMGYKLSYERGGKYNNIGVYANWGVKLQNNKCGNYARHHPNNVGDCQQNYNWSGFDCSGFVAWALTNGFQRKIDQVNTNPGNDGYKPIEIDTNTPVCKIGGVLVNSGHIVLVVNVDTNNKTYTIAQSTGSSGMGLAVFPFSKKGWGSDYVCKNLEELYGD